MDAAQELQQLVERQQGELRAATAAPSLRQDQLEAENAELTGQLGAMSAQLRAMDAALQQAAARQVRKGL